MTGNITFTMIKPDAVSKGYTGAILAQIIDAGFKIVAMKQMKLSLEQVEQFYSIHKGKSFYPNLINFMSSGPIVAAILEKENAVDKFRELIGSTDSTQAEKGTIRNLYGENMAKNAIHGSDSDENAIIESDFFFSKTDRC
jgi:nucleoside-diphosphate kinase